MYTPKHFTNERLDLIEAVIDHNPLGILISGGNGGQRVSHLPFIYAPTFAPKGRLLAHMARANPQWQDFSEGQEVLVIFQGPHAYVSPTWYASSGVPTWNYAAVHFNGTVRMTDDEEGMDRILKQLTARHEQGLPHPWTMDAVTDKKASLFASIIGLEIEVTEIQAKFKLSQNRPAEDFGRVVSHLQQSDDSRSIEVARLMCMLAEEDSAGSKSCNPI